MDAQIYTQRANAAFEAELAARTAQRHAAFVLPHLHAGMRLLDIGCGPGSITLDLADVVFPGEVVGIDIQPHLVEQARARAERRRARERSEQAYPRAHACGQMNVRFDVADLHRLPFADASFDAAFGNAVLMHLHEPICALAELRRVLRPGGLAAVRDPDFGTAVYAPMTPMLQRWLELRVRVRRDNGADPSDARHHRAWLLEAGFARAQAGASLDVAGTDDQTRRHAVFLRAQLEGVARTAIARGWADQAALAAALADIEAWSLRPDAFFAMTWCDAIGWVA